MNLAETHEGRIRPNGNRGPSHCHSNREFAISTSSVAVHLGCGKAPHSSATGVTGVEAVAARGSRQCIILVAVGAPQRLIS